MNLYTVLLDLKKKRQMHLSHTALRSQWSAEGVRWDQPHRITSRKLKEELAKALTPMLSDVSDGILGDEARHLGFDHIDLEDRFRQPYEQDPAEAESVDA